MLSNITQVRKAATGDANIVFIRSVTRRINSQVLKRKYLKRISVCFLFVFRKTKTHTVIWCEPVYHIALTQVDAAPHGGGAGGVKISQAPLRGTEMCVFIGSRYYRLCRNPCPTETEFQCSTLTAMNTTSVCCNIRLQHLNASYNISPESVSYSTPLGSLAFRMKSSSRTLSGSS